MSPLRLLTALRLTVVLTVLAALIGAGFAHRIDRSDAQLAAMVALGVQPGDICNSDGPDHDRSGDCDACRIVDATLTPPPSGVLAPLGLAIAAGNTVTPGERHTSAAFDHARASRAPPVV